MAGHQWFGRLCLWDRRRPYYARLSRLSDRGFAVTPGTHDDAKRPCRAGDSARWAHGPARRRRAREYTSTVAWRRFLERVPAGCRPARMALSGGRFCLREAAYAAAWAEYRLHQLSDSGRRWLA